MSGWSDWSDLAIVTAEVLFLVALILHAVEWGFARTVTTRAAARTKSVRGSRSESTAARRQRSRVGAGAAADSDADDTFAAYEAGAGDQGPDDEASSGIADAAEADLSARERRIELFGRLGVNIAAIGAASTVLGVVLRGVAAERAPWGNMYEFTISAVAIIAIAYVVMAYRFSMRWLGLPVMLVLSLATGLAVTVFHVGVAPLVPSLNSVWFLIHIFAAALAGAAFNVGALASILYLIRSRMERKEKVSGYFTRIPHSDKLDAFAYRVHAFAFPLWTFGVAAGAVWAQFAWGRFWGWDPKETWALITWVIYACYLHARVTAGWKGRRAAIIAIIGLASFWFNFVGVNLLLDGLHSYAGI